MGGCSFQLPPNRSKGAGPGARVMQRIHKPVSEFLDDAVPLIVDPDVSVDRAVELMERNAAGCALIVDDRRLVGIFTGRDFLNRVAATERIPADTAICEVMTPDPETLAPEDCVSYAIARMTGGGFRNVPIVVDDKTVGVLSVRHVMAHLSEVFAEIEDPAADETDMEEWIDIGGG